jgi:hypothetical protein
MIIQVLACEAVSTLVEITVAPKYNFTVVTSAVETPSPHAVILSEFPLVARLLAANDEVIRLSSVVSAPVPTTEEFRVIALLISACDVVPPTAREMFVTPDPSATLNEELPAGPNVA